MMGCLTCFLLWGASAVIALKLWVKLTTGWCRSNVCLVGKTAIITGANSGIGYETALDLAKRGAKVILACRSKGPETEEKIRRETDNPNVFYKHLELLSLKSVRAFADDINKNEDRLDILINNAGVGYVGEGKTEDGLSMLMQTNHFSHFLLTNLLLDLLKKTQNSRIINVASIGARFARNFNVNTLNTSPGRELGWYAHTKLCNVLFTIELANRLRGTGVTAYSLHPGAVLTNVFHRMPTCTRVTWEKTISWFFKNALEGAQTTIHCAVAKGIEELSGEHFEDCHPVKRYKTASDPELPKQLWKVSEAAVGLGKK